MADGSDTINYKVRVYDVENNTLEGVKVEADASSGNNIEVNDDGKITTATTDENGEVTFEISSTEIQETAEIIFNEQESGDENKTTTQAKFIEPADIESIAIDGFFNRPNKTVYDSGESLNLSGLVITETYTDGYTSITEFDDADWNAEYTSNPKHGDEVDTSNRGEWYGEGITIIHEPSEKTINFGLKVYGNVNLDIDSLSKNKTNEEANIQFDLLEDVDDTVPVTISVGDQNTDSDLEFVNTGDWELYNAADEKITDNVKLTIGANNRTITIESNNGKTIPEDTYTLLVKYNSGATEETMDVNVNVFYFIRSYDNAVVIE